MIFPTLGVLLMLLVTLLSSIRHNWQSDNGSEALFYFSILIAFAYFILVKIYDVPGR